MSLKALAETLDALASAKQALITESEDCVVVSALAADAAKQLVPLVEAMGWVYELVDGRDNSFDACALDDDFKPFRLTIHKVRPETDDALYLLTTEGFRKWLAREHSATHWRLARLRTPLFSQARVYSGWEATPPHTPCPKTLSPRALVRETGSSRQAPEDIRHWLLADGSQLRLDDALHQVWAALAFEALSRSLCTELDPVGTELIFKGPPMLRLTPVAMNEQCIAAWGYAAFNVLQTAARWVYDLGREAEIKHAMLAAEIARSGRGNGEAPAYLAAHLGNALEGAKAVYLMHLSNITGETLSALAALRTNVSDDAARATEATQQALTKVAAALAAGLSVLATRLGTDVNPWLVSLAMVIVFAYCAVEVAAGWRLIKERQHIRDAWQPRLYRFLPQAEYQKMVTRPANRSERVYLWATLSGLALVAALSAGVVGYSFSSAEPAAPPPDSRKQEPEAEVDRMERQPGYRLLWSTLTSGTYPSEWQVPR